MSPMRLGPTQAVAKRGVDLLISGAANALAAAGCGGHEQVVPAEVLALASAPTRRVTKSHVTRAFLPTPRGWVSIALAGRHEATRLRAALRVVGAEWQGRRGIATDLEPEQLASWLQQLGLAVLPAHVIDPSDVVEVKVRPTSIRQRPCWAINHGYPLAGVRVVELGHVAAAPHAGAVFQDLGASVVAVSHPARASSRWHGPDPLMIDITTNTGQNQFGDLCKTADIVIDNFRERVWENLGLDPLELGARVHLRLPAFTAGDPRRDWRAFGFQIEAMLGVGSAPPANATTVVNAPTIALLDHAVGFVGVAAAIHSLPKGGRVEVSQVDLAGTISRW